MASKQSQRPVPDRYTEFMLDDRMRARIEAKQEDWLEEGSQAALDNNPRRAWYLDCMVERLPDMVAEALSTPRETDD